MNYLLILLPLIFFASCEQAPKENKSIIEKITVEEKSGPDTVVKTPEEENISPLQKELNKALADPGIDNYYKEIYKQEKLIQTDELKMLSIPKNLFTKDTDKDLFYFIVFTKSMNGSDGFYSEAVGRSAYRFLTEKTEWFADYFNIAPKLSEQDMDNWARCVYSEIRISNEGEDTKAANELEKKLLTSIKEARGEYEEVINHFMKALRRQLKKH